MSAQRETCPHCKQTFAELVDVLTHPCPVVQARRQRSDEMQTARYRRRWIRNVQDARGARKQPERCGEG